MTKMVLLVSVLALGACKKKSSEGPPTAGSGSAASGSAGSGSAMAAGSGSGSSSAGSGVAEAGSGSAAGSAAGSGAVAWDGKSKLEIPGFQTPESVLHDPHNDVYIVSNINGTPLDVDDNGFISKLKPDGTVVDLKWIDGAKDNIKLNAPKGLAITKNAKEGLLWVADIDTVRTFDLETGAPKAEYKIEGATFLNDVIMDGDGGVFVSDTGLDASFKSTGTDAIYRILDGKVTPLIKDKALGGPNGLGHGPKGLLYVASFASGELYSVDHTGKMGKLEKLAKGLLDGIASHELGDMLVSSWEGKAIYRGNPGGPWKAVVENQEAPADIGWDGTRQRLLIPAFQSNVVVIVPLP